MRPIRIKFNSDRQSDFRIQTSVYQEKGKKIIIKKTLTKEAEKHLNEMLLNRELLKKIYPTYYICNAKRINENEILFEFLRGEEFAKKYERAIETRNKHEFQEALLEQTNMILSCEEDNFCPFYVTDEFEKIFGDGKVFLEKRAMMTSNFEFTSHNIIIDPQTHSVSLIDYEYVFSFPVPVELIIFHCVIVTNMLTVDGFNLLYSKDEILQMLGLYENRGALENAWNRFNMFFGQSGIGAAKTKYLKSCENVSEIKYKNFQMGQEILGNKNYITILTNDLEKQQNYIQAQDTMLNNQKQEILETKNRVSILTNDLEKQKKLMDAQKQEILGNKNYISILNNNLEKQQYYIQNQKRIIESQKNSIVEKQEDIVDLEKQLKKMQEILEEEQQKNINMKKSISWRATAFMRTIMDYIKK